MLGTRTNVADLQTTDMHMASTTVTRNGYHFVLSSRFDSNETTQQFNCKTLWTLTLHSAFYLDPHELALYTTKNYTTSKPTDPERPVHAVSSEPLEIAIDLSSEPTSVVDIPIHLRYAEPSTNDDKRNEIVLDCPTYRMACDNGEGRGFFIVSKLTPFDMTSCRVQLVCCF